MKTEKIVKYEFAGSWGWLILLMGLFWPCALLYYYLGRREVVKTYKVK